MREVRYDCRQTVYSRQRTATAVRLFQANARSSTKAAFRRDAAGVRSQCFLERVDWPIETSYRTSSA